MRKTHIFADFRTSFQFSQCCSMFATFAIFAISVSQCFRQVSQIVFRKFRKYEFRKVSQIQVSQFYVCFARFARFLTQILFSSAESSSLRDAHGISTGKTSLCPAGDTGTILFGVAPQLWRGAPRRARRSLRGRPCPRHPQPPPPQAAATSPTSRRPVPPSASFAAPRNRAEREALADPVLSVIRRRALATVADCGISMWLP